MNVELRFRRHFDMISGLEENKNKDEGRKKE